MHSLLELSPGGHWRMWDLQEQSGRPSEPPAVSGTWFIHNQSLCLAVDHCSEGGGVGPAPGLAWIFDLNAVNPQELHLRWDAMKDRTITWRHVVESADAGNTSSSARAASANEALRILKAVSVEGKWYSEDEKMRVELSPDGHWRWWDLQEQGGSTPQSPLMSGKWFFHEQAVYLRIEQHREGGGHGFMPGVTMIFRAGAADAHELHFQVGRDEMTWRRMPD